MTILPFSADNFADHLDALLGNKPKKKVAREAPNFIFIPPRITILRSWLTENARQTDAYYTHVFLPPVGSFDLGHENKGIIIHNHSDDKPCFTPDFCFEYGYRPPTGEKFSQLFWHKNRKYYEEVPSSPVRSGSNDLSGIFDLRL